MHDTLSIGFLLSPSNAQCLDWTMCIRDTPVIMYQLPPGQPNHTCGRANSWADGSGGGSMFCSAGSYCPTTVGCSISGLVLINEKAESTRLYKKIVGFVPQDDVV